MLGAPRVLHSTSCPTILDAVGLERPTDSGLSLRRWSRTDANWRTHLFAKMEHEHPHRCRRCCIAAPVREMDGTSGPQLAADRENPVEGITRTVLVKTGASQVGDRAARSLSAGAYAAWRRPARRALRPAGSIRTNGMISRQARNTRDPAPARGRTCRLVPTIPAIPVAAKELARLSRKTGGQTAGGGHKNRR